MNTYSEKKVWAVGGVWLLAAVVVAATTIILSTIVSGTDASKHRAFESCVTAGNHPLECREGLGR